MDTCYEDSRSVVLGSAILVFVEIVPIINVYESDFCDRRAAVTLAFTIKNKLQQISRRFKLEISWETPRTVGSTGKSDQNTQHETIASSSKGSSVPKWENPNRLKRGFLVSTEQMESMLIKTQQQDYPTISFPSDDPLEVEPIRCLVIGYAIDKGKNNISVASTSRRAAVILDGTLVRVLHPMPSKDIQHQLETDSFFFYRSFLDELVGELQTPDLPASFKEEIVCNHDARTIQQLKLRMSLLLADPVCIGTTEDALIQLERQQKRLKCIAATIQSYCRRQDMDSRLHPSPLPGKDDRSVSMSSSLPATLKDGALLVHSPHHAAGKTTLVKYIAQHLLMCDAVHVIQPAALLAKYGSQADAGLETMMHAITVSAAVKGRASICIILDHFNAMMPPNLSATFGDGDAAVPVLYAIGKWQ